MPVQVVGAIGTVQTKSSTITVFSFEQRIPIPALSLPSFPPALPSIPIPKLPSIPKPDFTLAFNPPKFAGGAGADGAASKYKALIPPSLIPGLSLPSFPPALPSIPVPKLPSLPKPDFQLSFNPPKFAGGAGADGAASKYKALVPPSLIPGLSLPSFPPALPSIPIPKLPTLPTVSLDDYKPYFNMKFPYPTVTSPTVTVTPIFKVE